MRASVLDEAAAARFSTAAALAAGKGRAMGVDWRDSTLHQREVGPPPGPRSPSAVHAPKP